MKGQAALVREQGINFAVFVVKRHTLNNRSKCDQIRRSLSPHFGGVPVVLMEQDHRGVPTYYGRPDLVRWLKNIFPEQLPWKEFTLSDAA